jgi:hypothetical protein
MCFIALWRTKLKSTADSESPCLTPDDTVMDLVSWFPTTTFACDLLSVKIYQVPRNESKAARALHSGGPGSDFDQAAVYLNEFL